MKKLSTGILGILLAAAPLCAAPRTAAGKAPLVVGAVSHLLLPTAASSPGRFGAFYKTKISIFNATGSSYSIRAGLSQGSGDSTGDTRATSG